MGRLCVHVFVLFRVLRLWWPLGRQFFRFWVHWMEDKNPGNNIIECFPHGAPTTKFSYFIHFFNIFSTCFPHVFQMFSHFVIHVFTLFYIFSNFFLFIFRYLLHFLNIFQISAKLRKTRRRHYPKSANGRRVFRFWVYWM